MLVMITRCLFTCAPCCWIPRASHTRCRSRWRGSRTPSPLGHRQGGAPCSRFQNEYSPKHLVVENFCWHPWIPYQSEYIPIINLNYLTKRILNTKMLTATLIPKNITISNLHYLHHKQSCLSTSLYLFGDVENQLSPLRFVILHLCASWSIDQIHYWVIFSLIKNISNLPDQICLHKDDSHHHDLI